jgi:hypothetical protein
MNTHVIVDDCTQGYVVRAPGEPERHFTDREDALRFARSCHAWPLFDATWEFNFEDPEYDC